MLNKKLTRRQRDGLADQFDKIGTASALATIVSGFVTDKITVINAVVLFVLAVVLLVFAVVLRGGDTQ